MRSVYRGLLRLHPSSFEDRFGEDMLWIFDLSRQSETGIGLVLDCFISLCRQWIRCRRVWTFGLGLLINALLGHRLLFGL